MNPDLSKLPLCGQDWNAMEPLGDGRRFCARCRHPVADFRGMSKDEITLVHVLSGERVCGVYSPEQLAPVAAAEPRRCRSGLVTLALGASLLAARADAQSAQPPATEQAQLPRGAPPAQAAEEAAVTTAPAAQNDTLVIRGTVRDAETHAPLQSVMLVVAGTQHRAVTDAAGGYTLRVPDPGPGELYVRFGRIGYLTRTIRVRGNARHAVADVADVALTQVVIGLMGIVVVPTPGEERAAELRRVGYSVSRITGSR